MIKGIIFDFDGVISESVNVKTKAFAEMYEQFGDDVVKNVVSHHLSHGGISRYEKFRLYHKEFLGIELTKMKTQELANKFSKLVIKKVTDAPYVPGALEFIQNNYKKFDLFISTGTPENEIIDITTKKGINIYFKSIFGSPGEKTSHIKKIMKHKDYGKDEIIFVGDSDTDITAARENDIPIILRVHQFSNCKYDYNKLNKVDNLKGLLKIIKNSYKIQF